MSSQHLETVIRSAYEAYNARDFDRAASLYDEDLEVVSVATGEAYHGRAGYLQYVQGWAAAFPDGRVEVVHLALHGATALVELIARGTHTGTLVGAAGQVPPTGVPVELRICDVLELREQRIHRWRSYYDTATLLRQMGLFPSSPLHAPDRRAALGLYAEIEGSVTQSNKLAVQRFVEEVVNRRNPGLAAELCLPNLAWHGGSLGELRDVASYQELLGTFFSAFPDLHLDVQELIAEGDRVVARITTRGTHHGEFLGVPATGRALTCSGISVYRLVGGRILEEWFQQDLFAVMQQLDAVPAAIRPTRMIG